MLKPYVKRTYPYGEQRIYRFPNRRQVSVIRNTRGSYGGTAGLFEAWDYGDPDPKGWLTIMGVVAYLRRARNA